MDRINVIIGLLVHDSVGSARSRCLNASPSASLFNIKGNNDKFEWNVKLFLHFYCLLEVTEFSMNDDLSYIE
jgi:hypothetical protein